jgi:hypothetical protein
MFGSDELNGNIAALTNYVYCKYGTESWNKSIYWKEVLTRFFCSD